MPATRRIEGFESVYGEHHAMILGYLRRLTRKRDLAEELTQETFLRVHRGLGEYRGESKMATWIYRIATNVYIDHLRGAARAGPYPDEFDESSQDLPNQADPEASLPKLPDQLLEESEMGSCVREFVDGLPPEYQVVIVLHDLEGLGNREIARILGCSLDTVKIRIHRARQRLRAVLSEQCDFHYSEESVLRCDRKAPGHSGRS